MKVNKTVRTVLLFLLCFVLFISAQNIVYPDDSRFGNKAFATGSIQGDGVWMHVDTFMQQTDAVLNQYADALVRANIGTVFILGKKIDGSVNFPSPHALKLSFNHDPMQRLVSVLKSRKRKVFFYFPVNTDPAWNAKNPADIAWQYGNKQQKNPLMDPEKKLVNLTSTAYRSYILQLVLDAMSMYALDGIQLDYIRYRNAHFGFSPKENAMATERGINISKIQELAYTTFIQPGDWNTLLKYYDDQDKDVRSWVSLREDIVFSFAQFISHEVRKRQGLFSVTLVSSGATGSAYGAVHFGQSYIRLSSIADIAVPMAYHGSQADPADYVQSVIEGVKERISPSCKVFIGLQAYETSTANMNKAIAEARKNDIPIVLFRVGTFTMVHLDFFLSDSGDILLEAAIFQSTPQQDILGFEIRGLAGWLRFKTEKWSQDQCEFPDGFKVWGKSFIQGIGYVKVQLLLESCNGQFSGFLDPYAVVADAKVDWPTYTSSAIRFDHHLIRPDMQTIESNGVKANSISLKVSEGIAYILADDLKHWDFKVGHHALKKSLIIEKGFRRIVLSYPDRSAELFLLPSSEALSLDERISLELYPWVPLRKVLEIMGYSVFYVASVREIHLLKAEREAYFLSDKEIKHYNDFDWFWYSQDTVRIELEQLVNTDFYSLIRLVHEKGKRLCISVQPSWSNAQHAGTLFWMMREGVPRWNQPDMWEWNPTSKST